MKDWVKELENIMARLRQPDGCAWDRQQNYQTLKKYLIEECGEFLDAVDDEDYEGMCEELGDVLMNICFYSQLAKEDNKFDLQKIAQTVSEKMIRRHPHVFGNSDAKTPEEIAQQWQDIKTQEKPIKRTLAQEVPRNIPALMRAQKVQKKASKVGFDWPDWQGAFQKLQEEVSELEEALHSAKIDRISDELGDVFFSAINITRHQNLDSEDVVHQAINKFLTRFEKVEKIGGDLKQHSLKELDKLWDRAKEDESNSTTS